jgi:hypothetical protein
MAACCSAANAQVKAPKPPGGSVTGTVTIKGKPAPGITISARLGQTFSPFDPTFKVKTDQDGKYRMDIPPGSYRVSVLAPGFVPPTNTFRNETVVVRENETVEGIDFALVRGGVITGKVVDSNGRPVIDQYVRIIRVGRDAENFPSQNDVFRTDDRGIYRMFGLRPGSYKVFVGQEGGRVLTVYNGLPGYERTFHPATKVESEAAVIEVSEGSEAKNIDIAVEQAKPGFAVSGTVVESEGGKRLANVRLMLSEGGERLGAVSIGNTVTNSKGEFRIENLPAGNYSASVNRFDSDVFSDPVNFEVVDQDLERIVIKASKGGEVTGTLVLENTTDPNAWSNLSKLQLQLFVNTGGERGYSKPASIAPDGSFRVAGLQQGSGNFYLNAYDRRMLVGFLIVRVERDGVVLPPQFEIKSGEQLAGFKVVVSYGKGVIRGTVKAASGSFPPDTRLFVRINTPGDRTNRIRSPQVDPRGNFVIEGLPAGTYIIIAGAAAPGANRSTTTRQQVELSENGTTDLTLTIDLDAKPGNPQ